MALIHFWRTFEKSFRHALAGLRYAFREERNFQIEIIAGVLVFITTFLFPLSWIERSVVLLLMSTVLTLELLNTALERVLDMLKPRIHPYVKVVKDMVAGAVLLSSLTAFLIGLIIFFPYVWVILKSW